MIRDFYILLIAHIEIESKVIFFYEMFFYTRESGRVPPRGVRLSYTVRVSARLSLARHKPLTPPPYNTHIRFILSLSLILGTSGP